MADRAWLRHGERPRHRPGRRAPERASYGDVLLVERVRAAIAKLNPTLAAETRAEVLNKLLQAETPSLVAENRRLHRYMIEGVPVEVRRPGRHHRRRTGPTDRLRRPGRQRLAGGEPIHGHREQGEPPARRGDLRQRPAARRDRTEEPRRRERHPRRGLQPVADLQVADPVAVPHQRGARDLGRHRGPHRLADRRPRAVHAVAHRDGRRSGARRACRNWRRCSRACSTAAVSSIW